MVSNRFDILHCFIGDIQNFYTTVDNVYIPVDSVDMPSMGVDRLITGYKYFILTRFYSAFGQSFAAGCHPLDNICNIKTPGSLIKIQTE